MTLDSIPDPTKPLLACLSVWCMLMGVIILFQRRDIARWKKQAARPACGKCERKSSRVATAFVECEAIWSAHAEAFRADAESARAALHELVTAVEDYRSYEQPGRLGVRKGRLDAALAAARLASGQENPTPTDEGGAA